MIGNDKCVVPPDGWYCTRKAGHDGPCAALPVVDVEKPNDVAFSYSVTKKQVAQAKVWVEKHDLEKHAKAMKPYGEGGKLIRYSGAIGGAYTWEFTPTSLGIAVNLRCSCGEKFDVTDYDLW